MADWKNILSEGEEQLTEDELLRYLENNLPEEEKYSIERKLTNNTFEDEALQGLSQVHHKESLAKDISQLKQKLHQLTAKKHRKEKKEIKLLQYITIVILFLLFVCVIGYIVVTLYYRSAHHTQTILQTVFPTHT